MIGKRGEPISVEIVYALPNQQTLLKLTLDEECSIDEAIEQSGILAIHPEITLEDFRVGVYGHPAPLTQQIRNGDRIEVYRPLAADPREARRMKLESKRKIQLANHHRR